MGKSKKSKVTVVDHPVLVDELDETCNTYVPMIKEGMLTTKQAIKRMEENKGEQIKPHVFYYQLEQGSIRAVKIGHRYYYDPEDIDRVKFIKKAPVPEPIQYAEPVEVHSLDELRELAEEYGPLVDTEGMLKELYKKTRHRYSKETIKQRIRRKSLRYVAYMGSPKKRLYWFPRDQINNWRLQAKPDEEAV